MGYRVVGATISPRFLTRSTATRIRCTANLRHPSPPSPSPSPPIMCHRSIDHSHIITTRHYRVGTPAINPASRITTMAFTLLRVLLCCTVMTVKESVETGKGFFLRRALLLGRSLISFAFFLFLSDATLFIRIRVRSETNEKKVSQLEREILTGFWSNVPARAHSSSRIDRIALSACTTRQALSNDNYHIYNLRDCSNWRD